MPRIARVVGVGLPHHITQRGNYRQDVFVDAYDRQRYLAWMREYSEKYGLSILAYCLMPNHVHFIAIPHKSDSLAKTFNAAHMRYSQYFNNTLGQRGHLWQGRFYSCILDEPRLIRAARYVEMNPVRAGLVVMPWQWPWSSAITHIYGKGNGFIKLGNLFEITGMSCGSWREYLGFAEEGDFLENIRKHTFAGRPLGAEAFVAKLEVGFGRALSMLPIGRPRKD
jgi:putative transposase